MAYSCDSWIFIREGGDHDWLSEIRPFHRICRMDHQLYSRLTVRVVRDWLETVFFVLRDRRTFGGARSILVLQVAVPASENTKESLPATCHSSRLTICGQVFLFAKVLFVRYYW